MKQDGLALGKQYYTDSGSCQVKEGCIPALKPVNANVIRLYCARALVVPKKYPPLLSPSIPVVLVQVCIRSLSSTKWSPPSSSSGRARRRTWCR